MTDFIGHPLSSSFSMTFILEIEGGLFTKNLRSMF